MRLCYSCVSVYHGMGSRLHPSHRFGHNTLPGKKRSGQEPASASQLPKPVHHLVHRHRPHGAFRYKPFVQPRDSFPQDYTLEQMRVYLQHCYGIPIALRPQGIEGVKCPYCDCLHDHELPGHHVAPCKDEHQEQGMFVGDRYFIPNYGYAVCEYREGDGVNELIIPDNLLN